MSLSRGGINKIVNLGLTPLSRLPSTCELASLTDGNADAPRPSPLRHDPTLPNRMALPNSAKRCNFATFSP